MNNETEMLSILIGITDVEMQLTKTALNTTNEEKRDKMMDFIQKLHDGSLVYLHCYSENMALKQRYRKLFNENQTMANEIIKLKEEINFLNND